MELIGTISVTHQSMDIKSTSEAYLNGGSCIKNPRCPIRNFQKENITVNLTGEFSKPEMFSFSIFSTSSSPAYDTSLYLMFKKLETYTTP